MSLVRPYNIKAIPNVNEQKFADAWSVIEAEIDRLCAAAWKAGLRGKAAEELRNSKAANYYIYLFHYAMNIDNYMTRNNIDRTCISDEVHCKFKIQCVEDNLLCLSKEFGASYLDAWKKLAVVFNIELETLCDVPPEGEFEYCAFETIAFTQSIGTEDFECEEGESCSVIKNITI